MQYIGKLLIKPVTSEELKMDINVFIKDSEMPCLEKWQEELDKLNEEIKLNEEFSVKEDNGYIPCTIKGKEAGFEFYYDLFEDTMFDPEDDPDLKKKLDGRDRCVGFSIPGEKESIILGAYASAVLCKITNGLYWVDPDFVEAPDSVEKIREQLESIL